MAHSKPAGTSAKLSTYQECKKWNRTFSSVVCFLLDNLGYSDDMRKFRESSYEKLANNISRVIECTGMYCIATGSKGEGASMPLQGDYDTMLVTRDILCVENFSECSDFYILKAERNDSVPPGYTRVVAVHTKAPSLLGLICSSSVVYFTEDGLPYVSSAIFNNIIRKVQSSWRLSSYHMGNNHQDSYSGPALTRHGSLCINIAGMNFVGFVTDVDVVNSIYFYSSLYTTQLAARLSRRKWFSPSLINSICSTEGFIVPVGSIEGENLDLEWRISYVMTENKIIRNLNTTQFKLYVIMKMIAKELIKLPVMSSYVVKNVVLWICELNSQSRDTNPELCELTSRPDLLIDLIAKCLSFMKTCIINNHLPNYVIPERNLIASRLTSQSKQHLIGKLRHLLEDGRNIFCRLNIFIKHSPLSLVLAPSSVFFYGRKRDEIEKLYLLCNILSGKQFEADQFFRTTLFLECLLKAVSDEHIIYIMWKVVNLVTPEWMALGASGHHQALFDLFTARSHHFLS